ncbi:hypothetical protein [Streptomyces sp. NPDC001601]|uniref:hypothetical protein n=1 Tax=Streptomyces sp. NPDC001601 TaxID=3364592 RepID=UPI0036AD53DE
MSASDPATSLADADTIGETPEIVRDTKAIAMPMVAPGEADPAEPTFEPRIGDMVRDVGTGKIGKVMAAVGTYVQLRPVHGGIEWDAKPENLRPVSVAEALGPAVAAANARSRGEL